MPARCVSMRMTAYKHTLNLLNNEDSASGPPYFTAGDTMQMQIESSSSNSTQRTIGFAEFVIYQVK